MNGRAEHGLLCQRQVHGACLAYAIFITIIGWSCPLTYMEQWLLRRAGGPVYSGEFLPHYVWSRFGLTGSELPVAASLVTAICLAMLNQSPSRRLQQSCLNRRGEAMYPNEAKTIEQSIPDRRTMLLSGASERRF